jgi:cupin 2 domain-containing protein
MKETGNLFEPVGSLDAELVERLLVRDQVRIERIVSRGHSTPAGRWYDQPEDEWVVVLRGSATLRIEDGQPCQMVPGDWVFLPAHRRHRVEATADDVDTIWLAVFVAGRDDPDRGS